MVTRIRRNATVDNTKAIEALMKSISTAQESIEVASATVKTGISDLYDLMKASNLSAHAVEGIVATLYRPAGRSSTVISPFAFRKAVLDDKDYYSAVSISVTKAKELLPQKVLDTISVIKPAVAGEETVKVTRG